MNSVLQLLRYVDRNIEKAIVLVSYVAMAGIIFVEVIRRFLFDVQSAWSTTIPIYLFLFLTWSAAAYNTKVRAHLAFNEVRVRLPYHAQFACLVLDAVLWVGFAAIVIYFSVEQVIIAERNFAIVQGTNDVMQWWFYTATPVCWSLLVYRALQNLYADIRKFRAREPLLVSGGLLGSS